jgi:hypothetical protein
MRSAILLFAIVLPACAAAASQAEIPVRGEIPGFTCRKPALSRFVGRRATPELAAELRRASGAKAVRWVRPGSMITMDYRDDRLTVRVNARNRVIAANCG